MKTLIEKNWYWVNWKHLRYQHREYAQYMYFSHGKYHFQFGNGDWIPAVRYKIKSEHEVNIWLW